MQKFAFYFHCCDLGVTLVREAINRQPQRQLAWWEIEALLADHFLTHGNREQRKDRHSLMIYKDLSSTPQGRGLDMVGFLSVQDDKFPEEVSSRIFRILERETAIRFDWLNKFIYLMYSYPLDLDVHLVDGLEVCKLGTPGLSIVDAMAKI